MVVVGTGNTRVEVTGSLGVGSVEVVGETTTHTPTSVHSSVNRPKSAVAHIFGTPMET